MEKGRGLFDLKQGGVFLVDNAAIWITFGELFPFVAKQSMPKKCYRLPRNLMISACRSGVRPIGQEGRRLNSSCWDKYLFCNCKLLAKNASDPIVIVQGSGSTNAVGQPLGFPLYIVENPLLKFQMVRKTPGRSVRFKGWRAVLKGRAVLGALCLLDCNCHRNRRDKDIVDHAILG